MKVDLLLKDPVFQLNLLLWMAKEQDAENYYVYPLFHQLGFRIIYIETAFAFPEETTRAIQDSGLDISIEPEPDMILGRESDNKALYFEAKANSFSSNSTTCKQARAHLVASGPVFGEVLSPLNACLLCYVVPDSGCGPMSECLTALAKELSNKGLRRMALPWVFSFASPRVPRRAGRESCRSRSCTKVLLRAAGSVSCFGPSLADLMHGPPWLVFP